MAMAGGLQAHRKGVNELRRYGRRSYRRALLQSARYRATTRAMTTIHDFTAKSIDGVDKPLKDYAGKTLLIVNVASQCGLTPQYSGLQKLYEDYRARGLEVLGFPCNQFGAQEPGSEGQIKTFCETRFGVTFPMFAKLDVNGAGRHPVYNFLTSQPTQPDGPGDIQWNFAKFLVDKKGAVVARFSPTVTPSSSELIQAIEQTL
jgi:glutathione peroxidase